MIDRYRLFIDPWSVNIEPKPMARKDDNGEWVRYEDVNGLIDENELLKKFIALLDDGEGGSMHCESVMSQLNEEERMRMILISKGWI